MGVLLVIVGMAPNREPRVFILDPTQFKMVINQFLPMLFIQHRSVGIKQC